MQISLDQNVRGLYLINGVCFDTADYRVITDALVLYLLLNLLALGLELL